MTSYVLDTDHLSLLQQHHPQIRQRTAAVPPAAIAITIITAEEQLRGWLDAIRRHTSPGSPKQLWAYQGLRDLLLFFPQVNILPFDQAAAAMFDRLRQQRIRIGSQDLRIAATTLVLGATLVTRNERDFRQVPGLQVEDWSVAAPPGA